jgi:DNA polymerase III epsilon subunit family exonuclease
MRKHNFAFIDIETTGSNVLEHELIEIGCVLTTDELEVIEEFEFKIKPEHIGSADTVALKVNHYNEKDWETGYVLSDAMDILSKKVKGCIMVGHNVAFDAGFLEYTFAKLKLQNSMHYHKLDTVSMTWAKLHKNPDIDHFSLREMCKHFGIENKNPHSALSDARATYELYKKLMSI